MAKITSNEYVKVAWVLDASMTPAQAAVPPAAILNAALDLSPAIAWQDFALGSTDSDNVEDRGITDPGNAVSRGFSNFEGTLSFFRDSNLVRYYSFTQRTEKPSARCVLPPGLTLLELKSKW